MEWQPIEQEIERIIANEVSITIHGEQDYELDASNAARAVVRAVLVALSQPSKEMLSAGMDAASDSMDSDYDSDADGNRYDYTYLRSDAPAQVWRAMLAVAQGTSPGTAETPQEAQGRSPAGPVGETDAP